MKQFFTTMIMVALFFFGNSLSPHSLYASVNDDFTLSAPSSAGEVCASPNSGAVITMEYGIFYLNNYNGMVEMYTSSLPNGVQVTFSPSQINSTGTYALDIFNAENLNPGVYYFSIYGISDSGPSNTLEISFEVYGNFPSPTTLTSPTNNATNQPATVTLEWTPITNATSYHVEVGTDNTFINGVEFERGAYTGTQVEATLTTGTTYYWRVRPFNSCGTANNHQIYSFTTTNGNTADDFEFNFANTEQILCPGPNASYTFTADFLGNFNEDIELNVLSTPENPNVYYSDSFVSAEGEYTIFIETYTLPSGQYQYYLEATSPSITKGYYLDLVILQTDSEVPTLISPADGSIPSYTNVYFEWGASPNATTYDLQISKGDYDFSTLEYDFAGLVPNTYSTSLDQGSFYAWRVRSYSECGFASSWSNPQGFTTTSSGNNANFNVSIQNSTSFTCGEDVTYYFDITYNGSTNETITPSLINPPSQDYYFSDNTITSNGTYSCTFFYNEVVLPGTYDFQIDLNSSSTNYQEPLELIVDQSQPTIPNLISPADGTTGQSSFATLHWENPYDLGNSFYNYELATDPLFSNIIVSNSVYSTSADVFLNSSMSDTYYWRVSTYNAACGTTSEWSETFSFTTAGDNAPYDFEFTFDNPDVTHCVGYSAAFDFYADFLGNFNETVTLNVLSTPENPYVYYSENPINSSGHYTVFIDTYTLAPGYYQYYLEATSSSITKGYYLSVNITDSQAEVPTLVTPAEGGIRNHNDAYLDWEVNGNAISYDLQISRGDYNFDTLTYDINNVYESEYSLALEPSTFYAWRVRSTNDCGFISDWSTAQSFTTTSSHNNPNFSIYIQNASQRSCGSDVIYYFDVSYNGSFNETVNFSLHNPPSQDYYFPDNSITSEGTYSCIFHNTVNIPDGTYNFEIELTGSSTSYIRPLELVAKYVQPQTPTLITPSNGAVNQPHELVLYWEDYQESDFAAYLYEVATDAQFNNLIANNVSQTTDLYLSLDPNTATTYYWRISTIDACGNQSPYSDTFSFTITDSNNIPANNEVCNAIPLQCGDVYSGSTTLASYDNPNNSFAACGGSLGAPNLFYTFTGTGQEVVASLCNYADFDTRIDVYCASNTNCFEGSSYPDFTCITGNDDFCGTNSQVTFSTESGVDYYIMVHGFGSSTGDFELSLTCGSGCSQPSNDDCQATGLVCGFEGTAELLTVGNDNNCSPTIGTTSCTTTGLGPDCAFNAQVQDVWYRFNTGATGAVTLNLEPYGNTPASQLNYAIYSACGGTQLYCNLPSSASSSTMIENLPSESDVFLQVWSHNQQTGDFTVCVSKESSSTVVFNIGEACGNSGSTVSIPFTVQNFTNISAMQFSIQLGTGVGTIQGISDFNLDGSNTFNITGADHTLQFEWTANNGSGETLNDETTIFNLDIALSGSGNQSAAIYVNGNPTQIYIGQGSIADPIPYQFGLGSACITNDYSISGNFYTPQNNPVDEVAVLVNSSDSYGTGAQFYYTVPNIQNGDNVTITPSKYESNITGINVIDRIIVRRHLVSQATFTSPYQYIAADVNANGIVNVQDVFLMKRATLENTPFPGGLSWMFIDASHIFSDASNPFPFPQARTYNGVNSDANDGHFTAVKLGDLDESSMNNVQSSTSLAKNNAGPISIKSDNATGTPNNIVNIPVRVTGFNDVVGFEFAIEWDNTKLEYESIQGFAISSLDMSDFGVSDNKMMVSWDDISNAQTIVDEESLFVMTFRVPAGVEKTTTPVTFSADPCFAFENDPVTCSTEASASGSQVAIDDAAPLPVTLAHFTANATKQSAVRLDWRAETEINLHHFDVLASANGQDWNTIGQVLANQSINYDFLDNKPVNGENFYRLRMVDNDGVTQFSPIRTVTLSQQDELYITNPVRDLLTMDIQVPADRTEQVTIYDVKGHAVYQSIQSLEAGNNTIKINTALFPAGIYFIQLEHQMLPYKMVKVL